MTNTNNKSLVVYYSRKGQNYREGKIVNLSIGNTEVIAKKIQSLTQSDIFEIKTIKDYPIDYTESTIVAKDELRKNARPELSSFIENMDAYDVIYLGYPNWWNTFPMAVFTFLETYDFSGKTIFLFCTHEGSGLGSSEHDIKKLCPTAIVKKGIAIRGGTVNDADNSIKSWL